MSDRCADSAKGLREVLLVGFRCWELKDIWDNCYKKTAGVQSRRDGDELVWQKLGNVRIRGTRATTRHWLAVRACFAENARQNYVVSVWLARCGHRFHLLERSSSDHRGMKVSVTQGQIRPLQIPEAGRPPGTRNPNLDGLRRVAVGRGCLLDELRELARRRCTGLSDDRSCTTRSVLPNSYFGKNIPPSPSGAVSKRATGRQSGKSRNQGFPQAQGLISTVPDRHCRRAARLKP